jgi:hypothetical protein
MSGILMISIAVAICVAIFAIIDIVNYVKEYRKKRKPIHPHPSDRAKLTLGHHE